MKLIITFMVLTSSIIGSPVEYDKLKTLYKNITLEQYVIIKKHSEDINIDIRLICALIEEESHFMENKIGNSGEYGIMQVMPYHHKTPHKLRDTEINVQTGTGYLERCVKKAKRLYPMNYRIHAIRFYNGGLNNRIYRYKRWAYVYRVVRNYKNSLTN